MIHQGADLIVTLRDQQSRQDGSKSDEGSCIRAGSRGFAVSGELMWIPQSLPNSSK